MFTTETKEARDWATPAGGFQTVKTFYSVVPGSSGGAGWREIGQLSPIEGNFRVDRIIHQKQNIPSFKCIHTAGEPQEATTLYLDSNSFLPKFSLYNWSTRLQISLALFIFLIVLQKKEMGEKTELDQEYMFICRAVHNHQASKIQGRKCVGLRIERRKSKRAQAK